METVKRAIMPRNGIGFFKAILESYEEIALLTVLNGRTGEVEIIYPSSAEESVIGIMEDMKKYGITFEEVDDAE